ncbi:MAG: AI-2E family transporter [Vallitaleaceae bacterium]|jgi:predicted PurR-regulated permease PerM|nr:AI-2E family transporter [Vallitaleaceae bacterium]
MKISKELSLTKYFIIFILSALIAKFLWQEGLTLINNAFKPLIMALIFIYLLDPLADFLNRKTKLSRQWSVIVSYIAMFGFMVLFGFMVIPSIINSTKHLLNNMDGYTESAFMGMLNKVPLLSSYIDISSLEALLLDIETLIVSYSSDILNYSTNILASIGSVLWGVVLFLMALLMSFFALKDSDHIGKKLEDILMAYLPDELALKIIRVAKLTDSAIKKYLVSKLYTCLILGVLVFISILLVNWLSPFDIPYVPLMAFIVGLSNLIPYVGWLIAIPAMLLAFLAGIGEGIALLAIIVLTQQIDNLIISPKVVSEHVGLKPFWVIVSITIGGSLFGAVGMIVSVPVVSVLLKLIEEHVTQYQAQKKQQAIHNASVEETMAENIAETKS